MRFFEGQDVIAFISDKVMDFQPTDFDAPLTGVQRDYLKKECGLDVPHVFWRKQVHGDDVLVAKDSSHSSKGCPDADAYITCQKNLALAIRTADCVPVFLFDPIQRAIGLVHAGWKGTHREITYKTVLRMQEVFGCKIENIQAVLGPAIQPCCYEVGEEFRQYFPNEIIERVGKLYVDVTKNNHKQLIKAGIKKEHILNTGICTHCNPKYFSFRRDAEKAGRMISLMVLV
jgi:polyphenol oxidase